MFGEYRCDGCGNSWKSAYSWANTWQKCKKCQKEVYPNSQRPLAKRFEVKFECSLCCSNWSKVMSDAELRMEGVQPYDVENGDLEPRLSEECDGCGNSVTPTVKWAHSDLDKPHLQEKCQKCIKLGRHCGGRRYM